MSLKINNNTETNIDLMSSKIKKLKKELRELEEKR